MAIREGVVINVGEGDYLSYPRYGFQFFCFRSPEMVQEMNMFIKYAKGKRCLFDIGAYHGMFSLVFTSLNNDGISFAFEPFKMQLEVISRIKNDRIFCYDYALSDRNETVPMFDYDGHLEFKKRVDIQSEYTCETITGDYFYSHYPHQLKPDILKIDVEGAEFLVLRGMKKVIEQNFPLIFLEIHPYFLKSDWKDELQDLIDRYNYKIKHTQTDELISVKDVHKMNENEIRIILFHEPDRELFNRYMEFK